MDEHRCPIPYCNWELDYSDAPQMVYRDNGVRPPNTLPMTASRFGSNDFRFGTVDGAADMLSTIPGVALAAHLVRQHPKDRRVPPGVFLYPYS